MSDAPSSSFLPVIGLAVSPMILLTGVGGLMITLTNRMARIVDRTRDLAGKVRQAKGEDREHFDSQLAVLWRRARLIRQAVTFAALSMLLSCLLVAVIFLDAWLGGRLGLLMVAFFSAGILSLVTALIAFLRDIFLSLHALKLEIDRAHRTPPPS